MGRAWGREHRDCFRMDSNWNDSNCCCFHHSKTRRRHLNVRNIIGRAPWFVIGRAHVNDARHEPNARRLWLVCRGYQDSLNPNGLNRNGYGLALEGFTTIFTLRYCFLFARRLGEVCCCAYAPHRCHKECPLAACGWPWASLGLSRWLSIQTKLS